MHKPVKLEMPYGSEDTSSMAIGASSTLCPNAASRSRSPLLPSSTATAPGIPDLRSLAPAAPLPSRHSPASPSPAPGQQTQGITPGWCMCSITLLSL
ncbi:hypothetical protein CgunFtcFv8_025030 [Champsocephalus gunnari]|uniref:Uncharacterized protein n=1 Tax=Champsocephalus gunnari TaxID=52237 RepID=A0AAN8DFN7_CHAGU|nr:hypothetical protein CgunFtcFv8_025030 [Champsocephalus gunnari]